MQLYLEGHNVNRGYAVSVQYADYEITAMPLVMGDEQIEPVRYYENRRHADRVIARFNRRLGTK
ncbi:hypothetical protein KZ843_09595 [Pseudomonas aeruginosa]|nr:hypothetical protein [Pseudomonas aeruginosa]MBW6123138.1 hypothetical protein [Pseudomonas aeruginosa]